MKKKAFTLVELLIVVVIIGILATFVVLALGNATNRTRNARAKRSIEAARDSLQQYIAANEDLSGLTSAVPGSSNYIDASLYNSALQQGGATGFQSKAQDATSNGEVKIKIKNATTYEIMGESTDSGNCFYYAADTGSGGKTADNLSSSSPSQACNVDIAGI